jgi:large subunit ribosomal protein L29
MKPRDIRELSDAELAARIRETEQELVGLRLKHRSGVAVGKPVELRHLRRDIARMKTITVERERLA